MEPEVSRSLAALYIDGLVQDCSISSVFALEILQSCTKPSILTQVQENVSDSAPKVDEYHLIVWYFMPFLKIPNFILSIHFLINRSDTELDM